MRTSAIPYIFCLICCCALHAELKTYPVPDHGSLQLDIPPDWRDTFLAGGTLTTRYPAIRLAPRKSDSFEANISIIPNDEENKDFNSPAKVKQRAEVAGNHFIKLDASKEKTLDLHEVKTPTVVIYHYTLSNKDPKATLKKVCGIFAGLGDISLNTTVRMDDNEEALRDRLIEIIKNARQLEKAPANAPPAAPAQAELRLPAPDRNWELVVKEGSMFTVDGTTTKGPHREILATGAGKVTLSMFIEPAHYPGKPNDALEYYLRNSKRTFDRENVKRKDLPEKSILEYTVPALNQKTICNYLVYDGMWVEVKMSKVNFGREDSALFEKVLNSIAIENKNAATKPAEGPAQP